MKYHAIKRRYVGKGIQFCKRVVLPFGLLYFAFYFFSSSTDQNLAVPEDNFIVPGEALDPLFQGEIDTKMNYKVGHKEKENAGQKSVEFKEQSKGTQDHKKQSFKPSFSVRETKKVEEKIPSQNEDPNSAFADPSIPERIQTNWSMAKANIPDKEKVRFKPHAITNDTVTLTLMSSADKVFISINKKQIYKGLMSRGMHVVVLNQYSGRVMAKRVFDTFQKGVEEDMVDFLSDITSGRIIVFAVLDEVATGLSWKGRNALKELGSRFADKIAYRDMWAMVTRKDGLKIAETFSNVATADTGYEWGGPIFMRTDFDLEEKPVECQWKFNVRNQDRKAFCVRFEGYGELCRCEVLQWEDVFFKVNNGEQLHKELSSNKLYDDLAVVVLATNRSHYLYRTLKSLYEAPGLNKDLVAIYAEMPSREVFSLCKLFGFPLVSTAKFEGVSTPAAIRHKMLTVFRDIMKVKIDPTKIPEAKTPEGFLPPFEAKNLLVVEEDLILSVDVFKYLHSVYPILERDESVVAISAFNYHSFRDVVDSQTRSYRTSRAQNLAMLLPIRTVQDILLPHWPNLDDEDNEWFHGLEVEMKGQKDIIHPEISRAKHSSYEGFLIAGQVQELFFKNHMISLTTEYDIPQKEIDRLMVKEYGEDVGKALKDSSETTFDFCSYDFAYGNEPQVVYINYDEKDDTTWNYIMKCLKTWSVYPMGGWRNVWQFNYHGHPLSVVGVPASPFSSYKSSEYQVMKAPRNVTSASTKETPNKA